MPDRDLKAFQQAVVQRERELAEEFNEAEVRRSIVFTREDTIAVVVNTRALIAQAKMMVRLLGVIVLLLGAIAWRLWFGHP